MGESRSFSSCPPLLHYLSIAKYFQILLHHLSIAKYFQILISKGVDFLFQQGYRLCLQSERPAQKSILPSWFSPEMGEIYLKWARFISPKILKVEQVPKEAGKGRPSSPKGRAGFIELPAFASLETFHILSSSSPTLTI